MVRICATDFKNFFAWKFDGLLDSWNLNQRPREHHHSDQSCRDDLGHALSRNDFDANASALLDDVGHGNSGDYCDSRSDWRASDVALGSLFGRSFL